MNVHRTDITVDVLQKRTTQTQSSLLERTSLTSEALNFLLGLHGASTLF